MRGVIRGGAQHILDVAVTVEPLDPMKNAGLVEGFDAPR